MTYSAENRLVGVAASAAEQYENTPRTLQEPPDYGLDHESRLMREHKKALRVLWAVNTAIANDLSSNTRILLPVLVMYADHKTGEFSAPLQDFPALTGLSYRAIRRSMKELTTRKVCLNVGLAKVGKGKRQIYRCPAASQNWNAEPDVEPANPIPGAGQLNMTPVEYAVITPSQARTLQEMVQEAKLSWSEARQIANERFKLELPEGDISGIPKELDKKVFATLKQIKQERLAEQSMLQPTSHPPAAAAMPQTVARQSNGTKPPLPPYDPATADPVAAQLWSQMQPLLLANPQCARYRRPIEDAHGHRITDQSLIVITANPNDVLALDCMAADHAAPVFNQAGYPALKLWPMSSPD